MSITSDDFLTAITSLHNVWQRRNEATEWEDVRLLKQYDTSFLRIIRRLSTVSTERSSIRTNSDESAENEAEEVEEEDPEALKPPECNNSSESRVIYDIIRSPSYQVPVLYLSIEDLASSKRPSTDEVHRLLVPDAFKQQVEAVGVVGALSMTDHPMTNLPSYFVHPCRTQEALEALSAAAGLEPKEYLMRWLGLVGGSVGLSVPVEVAMRMVNQ